MNVGDEYIFNGRTYLISRIVGSWNDKGTSRPIPVTGSLAVGFSAHRRGLEGKAFADQNGQTYFGWIVPPGNVVETKKLDADPGMAKAMKEFVSGVGTSGGVDSMTFSTGGKSVTIDKAAAKRIRKNADEILGDDVAKEFKRKGILA